MLFSNFYNVMNVESKGQMKLTLQRWKKFNSHMDEIDFWNFILMRHVTKKPDSCCFLLLFNSRSLNNWQILVPSTYTQTHIVNHQVTLPTITAQKCDLNSQKNEVIFTSELSDSQLNLKYVSLFHFLFFFTNQPVIKMYFKKIYMPHEVHA